MAVLRGAVIAASLLLIGLVGFAYGVYWQTLRAEGPAEEDQPPLPSPLACLKGTVVVDTLLGDYGGMHLIGEQVLCARDWQISPVYGPDLDRFFQQGELQPWQAPPGQETQ